MCWVTQQGEIKLAGAIMVCKSTDFKVGPLSWIIQVSQYNQEEVRGVREGDLTGG